MATVENKPSDTQIVLMDAFLNVSKNSKSEKWNNGKTCSTFFFPLN